MSMKIEGLDKAIRGLDKLSGGTWVNAPLYEYARYVQAKSAPYPPPKPTSRREGRLGRNWNVRAGNRQAVIENQAPYSGWVQQRPTQAWMHQGHWTTVEDEAEKREAINTFERAIERKIRTFFSG